MTFYKISEAAAAQASGTNLVTGTGGNSELASSNRARFIRKIAVVGSSAAGTGSVIVTYGATKVGEYFVTSTGTVAVEGKDYLTLPPLMFCPAGTQLIVKTGTVGATNAMNVFLDVIEI
jgi:hypothetical protein